MPGRPASPPGVTSCCWIARAGTQGLRPVLPGIRLVDSAPEEIWQGDARGHVRLSTRSTRPACGPSASTTSAVRPVLLWDRETLGSPRRAIVSAGPAYGRAICERLRAEARGRGHGSDRTSSSTPTSCDQSTWLQENEPTHLALAREGCTPSAPSSPTSSPGRPVARGTSPTCPRLPAPCCSTCRPGSGPTRCALESAHPATCCPTSCRTGRRYYRPVVVLRPRGLDCGLAGDQQVGVVRPDRRGRRRQLPTTGSSTSTKHRRHDPAGRMLGCSRRCVANRRRAHPRARGIDLRELEPLWSGCATGWQIVGSAAETAAVAALVESSEGVVFVRPAPWSAPHRTRRARGTHPASP